MSLRFVIHQGTRRIVACAFIVLLVGCGGNTETGALQPTAVATAVIDTATPAATATSPTQQPPDPATTATASQTEQPPRSDAFQNPVIRSDFPDPGIIEVDGTYYAYATNGTGKNIQAATSTDLVNWTPLSDAMPALPKWAALRSGYVWAPEVFRIGSTYLMYYTARDKASDRQCVGVATSEQPEGKFRDTRDQPLVCQQDQGGTIDASPFQDGDKLYLYFKNDGNCCAQPTHIYVQELAPDGLRLVGSPTALVVNDEGWEGSVVEAPTMWKQDDRYYLFYSANNYASADYAIGYATCETPTGPCQDAPENPILTTSLTTEPPVIGPGHQTIVADDEGDTWLAYHVWELTAGGQRTDRRFMFLDPLTWDGGKPTVDGPTTRPQPVP